MKILPEIISTKNTVCNKFKTTYARFNEARHYGSRLGERTVSVYNKEDKLSQYKRAAQMRQVLKEVTPYNLPIIGGIVGMLFPMIGASVLFTVLGGIAGIGLYIYQKFQK